MTAPVLVAPPTVLRMSFERPGARTWVRVGRAATRATVLINGEIVGTHLGAWTPFEFEVTSHLRPAGETNDLEIRCEDSVHTTNGFLPVLGVRWCGVAAHGASPEVTIAAAPAAATVPAPPRARADGRTLLVDDKPCVVRGVLHWGYYPELSTPAPDSGQIRREITELQARGFNLIKFCLWVPPTEYYGLCDELGMLVWQEYPVWNAPLNDDADTQREFRELFVQDREFGCIILRTLTCENDRVAPAAARRLVALAHELIPGALVLDNSGWLCNEQVGDFCDEHPYVHNALWTGYGERTRGRVPDRPLILGETMVADSLNERYAGEIEPDAAAASRLLTLSQETALRVRRWQIERLAEMLPEAGYVICGLRDLPATPLGICTQDGRFKHTREQWSWHGRMPTARIRTARSARSAEPAPPEALIPGGAIQPPRGTILGPRKGAWKVADHTWWSPVVRVCDARLPADLIEREAAFDLLSGRVLCPHPGARVLVELCDVHSGALRRLPLVLEYRSQGRWCIASALRHDTDAGLALWDALARRPARTDIEPPAEIGALSADALVLEHWELHVEATSSSIHAPEAAFDPSEPWSAGAWSAVRCDTPLQNDFRTLFEGWATFRTRFEHPGGAWMLRCEAVGDYFELFVDGVRVGDAGPRRGTWDGTRDVPREFPIDGPAGPRTLVIRVRDWRAAGGLTGPIYLTRDPGLVIF